MKNSEEKDVVLSEEEEREISEIISTKKFKESIYMEDLSFFYKIIQFLKQLEVTQDNFRIIKMLLQHYGIYIIPYLKPFYNKIHQKITI